MSKTWVSPRKLNEFRVGTRVAFDGSRDWWTKGEDGRWFVPQYGIPFSAETLVHYNNGQPFRIVGATDE